MNATRTNELARLIAEKRVVFVDHYQGKSLKVTVNKDMPEWGVMAGDTVYLVASDSYAGYYYIQRYDAGRNAWTCGCMSRKPCKHEKHVAAVRKAEYQKQEDFASQAEAIIEAEKLAARQKHTLERTEWVLEQNAKQRERKARREQAALGKQERVVEEGPCGPVLMAS